MTQEEEAQMAEILDRLEPRFGSRELAYVWYSGEPIVGFAGRTVMQLVREGHADWVHRHIDAVDAGIHS
ncbi:antitoxin Xre/MbcA/ParS toxin-binding domain-containing protein [Pelagerythrobacter aerophilus]|uniref:DUF2384 domain-containing protein n=1 Tax=Pelagerythrobacter aerophilus TaxID=2306995 RepID=A0A418NKX0_9SPHN|nr:antitoxin Xre/MbcA/ParS toxin-binding domain-containing protein [Pelagerythrobacter aerophilus]RIV79944.1 DUF2384 domain-containing protein [Pelagerythrobacter aerophilus]